MESIFSTLRLIADEIKFDPKKLTPEDIEKMKVKVNIQASDLLHDRYVMAFIVEAGLRDDFMKIFEKGKVTWNKLWLDVKDKSVQLAIKGLRTVEQVKEFLAKNPNLKWVILAAIILGYLALPHEAMAQIIDAPTAKTLANNLSVHISPNALQITASPGWIQDVVMRTVQEGSTPDKINHDLIHNLANIIWEKTKMMDLSDDSRKEFAKTVFQAVFKGGSQLLKQYGIQYVDDLDPFSSLHC
jgi:hypothetical protein